MVLGIIICADVMFGMIARFLLLSLLTAMNAVKIPLLLFFCAVKLRGRSSSRRSVDRTKAADDTHLLPVFFARGRSGGLLCSFRSTRRVRIFLEKIGEKNISKLFVVTQIKACLFNNI